MSLLALETIANQSLTASIVDLVMFSIVISVVTLLGETWQVSEKMSSLKRYVM